MITLKDLPGIPAGTELKLTGDVYQVVKPTEYSLYQFHRTVVENQAEWFGDKQPVVADTPKKVSRPKKK